MQTKPLTGTVKRGPVLVLCLCLASISIVGQSQQEESPPKPEPVPPSQQRSEGKTKPPEAPQRAAPATQFNPTEKIRADDAVAFPVDI